MADFAPFFRVADYYVRLVFDSLSGVFDFQWGRRRKSWVRRVWQKSNMFDFLSNTSDFESSLFDYSNFESSQKKSHRFCLSFCLSFVAQIESSCDSFAFLGRKRSWLLSSAVGFSTVCGVSDTRVACLTQLALLVVRLQLLFWLLSCLCHFCSLSDKVWLFQFVRQKDKQARVVSLATFACLSFCATFVRHFF